jgi:hypothetical protein
MKDWKTIFNSLSDGEKDKVAVLRVMECANGVMQHAYREGQIFAYSTHETRKAMKFSMSCMKNMSIPLREETITFEPDTETLLREVRELYISGFKNGNDEDLEEFMIVSGACIRALGKERIVKAKDILAQNTTDIPLQALDWGVRYINQFFQ